MREVAGGHLGTPGIVDTDEQHAWLAIGDLCEQIAYSVVDVVADQPHPLHPLDSAGGGLVGVPHLDRARHPVDRFDLGFLSQNDHPVHPPEQVGIDGRGCLVGHVGAELGDRFRG